jgi:hypothetical protein
LASGPLLQFLPIEILNEVIKTNDLFRDAVLILVEQVSEVLEKWIKQELESDNYGEESVFNNTITNEWGQEIARRIRRQSESERPDTFTEDSAAIEPQVNANIGKGRNAPRVLQVHNDMGQDQ